MGDWLYFGSCDGAFYALDRNTGEVRWSHDTRQDGQEGSPVQFHGDFLATPDLVVVGSDGHPAGHIYAFERQSGRVRWKHAAPRGVARDLVRLGSQVYALALSDELICLDLDNGKLNWSLRAEGEPLSSPAAAAGRVFYAGRDGSIHALDAGSGRILWKRDLKLPATTSLAALGDDLYVGVSDVSWQTPWQETTLDRNRLYRLDQRTGTVLAELPVRATPLGRPTPAGGSILIVIGHALASLDLALKEIRWTGNLSHKSRDPRLVVWEDIAILGERGALAAFTLSDGTRRWTAPLEAHPAGLAIHEKGLYVGTTGGSLYAFSLQRRERP